MKIKKISGECIELDKRQLLPFKVTSTCPKCGSEETLYLMEDPGLSYPTLGENDISFYHPGWEDSEDENACSNEWSETAILDLTLTSKKKSK